MMPEFIRGRWWAIGLSLALVVAFFVLREHWGHALGLLPYILLLACPFLHLLHGHGGKAHHDGRNEGDRP